MEAGRYANGTPIEHSQGFGRKEINRIRSLVEQHQQQLLESWNEFFNG